MSRKSPHTPLACATLLTLLIQPFSGNAHAQVSEAAVALESVAFISPANSRISFVGTHVGDDPKPRLGGFAEFEGMIRVDAESKQLQSISVDINVDSIWTEFDNLTTHLKNADFFEVEKYPDASFVSTKITTLTDGKCKIVGDLTLHGVTKSIQFQGKFRFEDEGLFLTSDFHIDRSEFGMDQMLGGVEKAVSLEVIVGKATAMPGAEGGNGNSNAKNESQDTPSGLMVSLNLPNMT